MPCDNNVSLCHGVNFTSVTPTQNHLADASANLSSGLSSHPDPTTSLITPPFNTTSLITLDILTAANTSPSVSPLPPVSALNTTPSLLREDPVTLNRAEVVVTLCLSLLTIIANLAVLFLSKFAGGGQSPTMVFVRVLCMSDFLMGCYGLGKMLMFLFVERLLVNFFLPESLFFTASTASCLTLLLLNVDRCLKVAWPLWYLQRVDKPSIITGMVFVLNLSFILGFLPQLGWNSQGPTFLFSFFHFFPWPYLLLVGLTWLGCVAGSGAVLLWVRGRFDLTLHQQGPLSQHLTEVEKYGKLRVTLLLDLASWLLVYLPLFALWVVGCFHGVLGARPGVQVAVYHFVPVLMLRGLGAAALQLYRTVRVQGLVKKLEDSESSTPSSAHSQDHHQQDRSRNHQHWSLCHKRLSEENGVSAISYSNPLCEASASELTALGCAFPSFTMDAGHDLGEGGEEEEDMDHGINNPAYRPSVHFDQGQDLCGVTEQVTAL